MSGFYLLLSTISNPKTISNTICSLCGYHLESLHHLLTTCPYTRSTWFATKWNINLHNQRHLSVPEFITSWYLNLALDTPNQWPTICTSLSWNIWKERCQATFTKTKPRPPFILANYIQSLIPEDITRTSFTTVPIQVVSRWTLPAHPHLKLNVDIAFHIHGLVHIGYIIRDHLGYFIAASTSPTGAFTAEEGESRGLLQALQWALTLGHRDIILETDCLNVASFMQGHNCNLSNISRNILLDAKDLSLSFVYFLVLYSPRSCNNIAHKLANCAPNSDHVDWVEAPPARISQLLSLEASFCTP